ncbi:MAG: virulence RhuM family protein, partial [Chitinophagales bacterium]
MSEIIIYQSEDNQTQVEVQFEGETFWLTQEQISELFERDRTVITKHLRNIFKENELEELVVSANFAHTTKHGAIEGKTQEKSVKYYNLDAILSVGYRVNSKRGTQFRQWATKRLNEYLTKGYSINKKRLEELGQIVNLIQSSSKNEAIHLQEAKGLLQIITNYTQSFVLLNQFDSNSLTTDLLDKTVTYEISYKEAKLAITELKAHLETKKEATDLFGNEKDESFEGILGNIV